MKIRVDFVTNSSSSSYIIAFKKLTHLENSLTQLGNLHNVDKAVRIFAQTFSDEQYNIYRTIEDIDQKVLDWCSVQTLVEAYREYPECDKRFKSWYQTIKKGYCIIEIQVDYDDQETSFVIKKLSDGKNIIMLEEW